MEERALTNKRILSASAFQFSVVCLLSFSASVMYIIHNLSEESP